MRKSLKKIAAAVTTSVMLMAVAVTAVPNTADAATTVSKAGKKAGKADFDPAGTYHAYFGLQQTQTWIFRDPWYSETLGTEGTQYAENEGVTFNDILQSGSDGLLKMDGTVTDAEITGNGFYTVGVEGLNGCLLGNPDAVLAMLYVDTDIPVSAKETIQISDVKLVLDNKTQTLPEELFYNEEEETESKLIRFDPVNTYQKDQGAYPECPSVLTPRDSIKISFKISGMAQDNPDAVEATPTPAPKADDTEEADDDKGDDSGISPAFVGGIVVGVVVVIGAVVVVTKKKRN